MCIAIINNHWLTDSILTDNLFVTFHACPLDVNIPADIFTLLESRESNRLYARYDAEGITSLHR